jgi:ABC-type transport system involved in multi-copper enzyme maturation permease subunit
MKLKTRPGGASFWLSFRRVFALFFLLGRKAGKSRVFVLLGLIPVAIAVVVRIFMPGRAEDVVAVFNEILMVIYVTFYIVILSLFYGTSIVAEETENRTLSYLTTRPLAKSGIFLGKYAAYVTLMFLMVTTSLFFPFFIMNGHRFRDPALYLTFLRYTGALGLGILAYTALFAFLGTFLRRAILVGLLFGFGWENVIQYFPGSTQRLSLVHYMKSLMPRRAAGGGQLSILLFKLEPTEPAVAVLMLIVIAAAFLALACWLFRMREYLFED